MTNGKPLADKDEQLRQLEAKVIVRGFLAVVVGVGFSFVFVDQLNLPAWPMLILGLVLGLLIGLA